VRGRRQRMLLACTTGQSGMHWSWAIPKGRRPTNPKIGARGRAVIDRLLATSGGLEPCDHDKDGFALWISIRPGYLLCGFCYQAARVLAGDIRCAACAGAAGDGLGALNKGGGAEVNSVSCGAAGNCAAGGEYTNRGFNGQGFVAVERGGFWGQAIEVPGLGKLNAGFSAEVDSVSCASAGNCAAVGTYGEPYGTGFVVAEKKGVWGKAIDVGLIGGRIAGANSVSCASAGNCAAGGFYSDSSGGVTQGWVAVERLGRWGNGIEVPGLGALNKGGDAAVNSVSCPAAGSCAAGGYYTGRHQHSQGFVVSQTG